MKLTPEILEACYRAGAFPMADSHGRIEFYRSDPRSVLELEDLHVSRSLARVIRKGNYEVRVDEDFEGVTRACADREETWINAEIIDAYVRLHRRGKAHSVEAYSDGELVGGLYGVTLGGAFMGESMFSQDEGCLQGLLRLSRGALEGERLSCCSTARSRTPTLPVSGP